MALLMCHCLVSKMTYVVLGGALNSAHPPLCGKGSSKPYEREVSAALSVLWHLYAVLVLKLRFL